MCAAFKLLLLSAAIATLQCRPSLADELNDLNAEVAKLLKAGKYRQAVPVAKRALEFAEKKYGRYHPRVRKPLETLVTLSKPPRHIPNYDAVGYLYRSLKYREKTLGPDHPDVAQALYDMHQVPNVGASRNLAEKKRALAIREKAFGPNHLDIAASLHDIGRFHRSNSHLSKAEPLFKRALAIREKILGRDHPTGSDTIEELAEIYKRQKRYAKAAPLYRRLIKILEKKQAPMGRAEWGYFYNKLMTLSGIYQSQGKYAKALSLHKRGLAGFEKIHGRSLAILERAPGDAQVGILPGMLSTLAGLYELQGRDKEAESLYKRALSSRHDSYGSYLDLLKKVAAFYMARRRFKQAEQQVRHALEIVYETYVPHNAYIGDLLNELAVIYRALKRPDDLAMIELQLVSWRKCVASSKKGRICKKGPLTGLPKTGAPRR